MRDIKPTISKIKLDDAKADEIRSRLVSQKRVTHVWVIPVAAVLTLLIILMAVPYTRNAVVNAAKHIRTNSHPQLITEAAQRDINMEDAERRWQIIKANLVAYKEKQEEIRQLLNMPNPPTPPPPPPQEKMLSKRLKDWLKDKFNFKPRAKIKLE